MPRYCMSNLTALARVAALASTAAARSTQASIGPTGGSLALPSAGLTIVVPPGALDHHTKFKLSAHSALHGFTVTMDPPQPLNKRATVIQVLEDSQPTTDLLLGCTDMVEPTAICHELFAGTAAGQTATFQVPHFSGYIFAGGINGGQSCNPETDGPECVWVDDT
jgi:hypothetical protein